MQAHVVTHEPSFFVDPNGSKGSLGTCVPLDDTDGLTPRAIFYRPEAQGEGSPWGRRPERSEECLGIAR